MIKTARADLPTLPQIRPSHHININETSLSPVRARRFEDSPHVSHKCDGHKPVGAAHAQWFTVTSFASVQQNAQQVDAEWARSRVRNA